MASNVLSRCADLLYQEAAYLDERHWIEWLGLHTEDAEFWIPAWYDKIVRRMIPRRNCNASTTLAELVWKTECGALSQDCHRPPCRWRARVI